MGALIGGVIAAILGVLGIWHWFQEFKDFIQGGLPILLVLGGIIAIAAGISDIKDRIEENKEKAKKETEKKEEKPA